MIRTLLRSGGRGNVVMLLLFVALLGFLFPNGLYLYWVSTRFDSVGAAMSNELAVGFIVEAIIVTLIVAYRFYVSPLGKVPVYWFIILSLAGGVGFGIPAFYWLNKRSRVRKFSEMRNEIRSRQIRDFAVSQA